jgi:MFS family permease
VLLAIHVLLCGVVDNIWQLAALRFLAGIGIGGEWAMGGTFIAEEWPEERRKAGGGYMHTGYFGFFLAALASYVVGASADGAGCSWSAARLALLITFIRTA